MRLIAALFALAALAGCGGTTPEDDCRTIERALCAEEARCRDVTETECLRTLDDDARFRCATIVEVSGDVEACVQDVGRVQCSDVVQGGFPPSCDAVTLSH